MRWVPVLPLLLLPDLAEAITISERARPSEGIPAFGDFGGSIAGRSVLPPQTDVVYGTVFNLIQDFGPFDNDFFGIADLVPGTPFTLHLETDVDHSTAFTVFDVLGVVVIPTALVNAGSPPAPPTVVSASCR